MDFWNNIWDDEGEDPNNNEEVEKEPHFSNKDCIIFLIDCQKAMLERNEQGEIPFHNAIKCAIATLTDKIISSETDLLGICLYGTKTKKNPNDFENIMVLMDLDIPDAQNIIDLENILKQDEFELGSTNKEFMFYDALWTCSTMFSLCNVKVGHKRIFLFTNDDNPNANNPQARERSFQRAKDLSDLGIEIELFSMNRPDHKFDPSLFYHNIITFDEEEDLVSSQQFDAASKFEELRARVRRKEFKKRSLARLSFFITDGVEIGVRLYSLVHSTKKGFFVWLDSKSNQPVKTMTKYVCEDTGTLLMDSQIKYSYGYGGERVVFDKDELTQVKSMDKQGLRLLGFKPRSALKVYHNIRPSNFIYPDERYVKGSTTAFAALLDRMLHHDKIAICKFVTRQDTATKIVALLPQAEVLDPEDGTQMTPPGFHVIYLPFADDIRHLTFDSQAVNAKPNPEQVQAAKKMVKTLRVKFDSRNFENPSLQKHYAALQALALERDDIDDVVDYVVPDIDGMMRYENVMDAFGTAVFPVGYAPAPKKTYKRKAEGIEPKQEKKPIEEINLKEAVRSNEIKRYTVPELKEIMKSNGIKFHSKMKKDDLIDKIKEFILGGLDSDEDAAPNPNPANNNNNNANQRNDEEDDEVPLQQPNQKNKKQKVEPKVQQDDDTEGSDNEAGSKNAGNQPDEDTRPWCQYGASCYRKNPLHFKEFRHPDKD